MTDSHDDAEATVVPLTVVDGKGRRRRIGPDGADEGDVVALPAPGGELDELGRRAAEATVAFATRAWQLAVAPWRLTGAAVDRAAQTSLGTGVLRALQAALDESAAEGREDVAEAMRKIEAGVARALGVVVPVFVDALDVDQVLDDIDLDSVLDRIDIDRLLERIDVNRLLDRVDIDRLLERVDMDRIIDRVDVEALVGRAGIEEIVARSTSHVADSTVDLGRRQAVGLDAVTMRLVDRLLGRNPDTMPEGPAALVDPTEAGGDIP